MSRPKTRSFIHRMLAQSRYTMLAGSYFAPFGRCWTDSCRVDCSDWMKDSQNRLVRLPLLGQRPDNSSLPSQLHPVGVVLGKATGLHVIGTTNRLLPPEALWCGSNIEALSLFYTLRHLTGVKNLCIALFWFRSLSDSSRPNTAMLSCDNVYEVLVESC